MYVTWHKSYLAVSTPKCLKLIASPPNASSTHLHPLKKNWQICRLTKHDTPDLHKPLFPKSPMTHWSSSYILSYPATTNSTQPPPTIPDPPVSWLPFPATAGLTGYTCQIYHSSSARFVFHLAGVISGPLNLLLSWAWLIHPKWYIIVYVD